MSTLSASNHPVTTATVTGDGRSSLPPVVDSQAEVNALVAVKWIHYHQIEDNHDDSKILACGGGQQILLLLETLEAIGDVRTIKRMVCAADRQLTVLTETKFWTQYGCRIVSWRDDEYEEDIIRRTRLAAKQKPISTVIDFEPNLRRLHRQFYLVEEGGKVLLYQKRQPRWHEICAPLLPALASRSVTVEHLEDDCRYLMPSGSDAGSDVGSSVEDLAYGTSVSSTEFFDCDR